MTETTVAVAPLNFFPDVHAIWPNTMLSCTVGLFVGLRAHFGVAAAPSATRVAAASPGTTRTYKFSVTLQRSLSLYHHQAGGSSLTRCVLCRQLTQHTVSFRIFCSGTKNISLESPHVQVFLHSSAFPQPHHQAGGCRLTRCVLCRQLTTQQCTHC